MSAIEIPIILVDILGMIGSGYYYNAYIKGTEQQYTEPNFFMKFLLPGCTVCLHQGWDNPNDVAAVCCLGCCFTVFYWEPKNARSEKVYVTAEPCN
jgi:hypothetical protein